jgi:formylglycine-generating enzyme required for sulfatase activity/Tol biopolymer transport system component
MKLVLLPAGEFLMGAPDDEKGRQDNEIPQHPVRITQPFWLGVYEVTQEEYESLMGPHLSDSYQFLVDRHQRGKSPAARFPVDNVNWYRAAEFCNHLSDAEKLPAYYGLSAGQSGSPWRDVEIIGGPGYRLPTEAEWEYACRAGTATPFGFGGTIGEHQANVNKPPQGVRYRSNAAAVGSFQPNAFGLHDMHGNIAEWCNDVYRFDYYEDSPIDDPPGLSSDDRAGRVSRRSVVARGGSWSSSLKAARSAYREDEFPWHGSAVIGFRVARSNLGDWQAKLAEVARRDAAVTLSGHTATVMSLAFSPDGTTLASGSEDRTVRLWEVATAKNTATFDGHSQGVVSVAFSPDARTLASGSEDGTVRLWDLTTGKVRATLRGHTRGVASVVYSPDGTTLASGSWDETIKLWDVATERVTATLTGHTWSVRYRPDGKMLASAGAGDRTIKLWDAGTGENIRSLKGHIGPILCLAFSPDGKTLASASGEPMIRLWDVAMGKNAITLRQDFGQIHYVAFSPDGRTLATAAGGQPSGHTKGETTVRLWDTATGKSTVVLRGRPRGFRVVAYSPDGRTLASGSMDGPIKLSPLTAANESH